MNRDERLEQLKEYIKELTANIAAFRPNEHVKHIHIGYDNNGMPVATVDY